MASDSSIENISEHVVALVTGSSSGIGYDIALDLLNAGYSVVLTGRDQQRLLDKLNEIRKWTHHDLKRICIFAADLMCREQIDELLKFISKTHGRLDILINNACYRGDPVNVLHDKFTEQFTEIMNMNVAAPMYIIKKSIENFSHQDKPFVIVNISSIASKAVVQLHGYSISKACLSAMTRQLANLSDKLDNLICLTISPGPVLTSARPQHIHLQTMTLLNRVAETEEISNLVIECLKNPHLFNGIELFIDGGCLARQIKP